MFWSIDKKTVVFFLMLMSRLIPFLVARACSIKGIGLFMVSFNAVEVGLLIQILALLTRSCMQSLGKQFLYLPFKF